ncbi:unnamed protein product [Callosobruchus maculatus]|uniref:Uncharacterized protein n=1 Tax=Callosobruchus maculatus TaxID=64391 RepID=A0A653CE79_CALMS|nr:unnamed protein product [Callosobruchus maculatus]
MFVVSSFFLVRSSSIRTPIWINLGPKAVIKSER